MKKTLKLSYKPIIGIEIGYTHIKAMALDGSYRHVMGHASQPVDPAKMRRSLQSNDDYLTSMVKEMIASQITGKISSNHALVSIPTALTYSRTISIPLQAESKLRQAVMLEAEQYIPVAVNELNVSYEVLDRDDKNIEVLMSAAPKKVVNAVVSACQKAGVVVLAVEPSSNSVARLVTLTEEGSLPTLVVDINAATTDLAIIKNTLRANASVQVGGTTFTKDLSKSMHVSLEAAHQLKILHGLSHGPKRKDIAKALEPSLSQIVGEVTKMIRFYNQKVAKTSKIQQLIIVGSGSNIQGIGDYFTDKMLLPSRVANPWQRLQFTKVKAPPAQFKNQYLTVAGAACASAKELDT